jgi:hypothetical protein
MKNRRRSVFQVIALANKVASTDVQSIDAMRLRRKETVGVDVISDEDIRLWKIVEYFEARSIVQELNRQGIRFKQALEASCVNDDDESIKKFFREFRQSRV